MSSTVNLTGVPIPYPEQFLLSLNDTQLDYVRSICNTTVCSLSYAQIDYDPSLAGNAFYLALFVLFLVLQIGLGVRYRTWSYLCTMIPGLVLEVIGYVARVQMSNNPWLSNPFLIYLVCLTIAPVFFTAALYISFVKLIPLYDPSLSLPRLRPRNYIILFISFDIFSLILQAVGGAIADTANTHSSAQVGVHIMVAGLAVQVVSLFVFMSLCVDFAFRVGKLVPVMRRDAITGSWRMTGFVASIAIATLTIFIRSVFRCAELSGGFNGKLANEEVPFMILEGGMMSIALIAMTAFHPGFAMGGAFFVKLVERGNGGRVGGPEYNGVSERSSAYEMGGRGKGFGRGGV